MLISLSGSTSEEGSCTRRQNAWYDMSTMFMSISLWESSNGGNFYIRKKNNSEKESRLLKTRNYQK